LNETYQLAGSKIHQEWEEKGQHHDRQDNAPISQLVAHLSVSYYQGRA
jgi:hypothetical protein